MPESGKNASVNRITSKIDFFTVDIRETSCDIIVEKFMLKITLLTDGFLPNLDLFLIVVVTKRSLVLGTFGLG